MVDSMPNLIIMSSKSVYILVQNFVHFGIMIRHWSKVFISFISTHDRDLEVEVTDLEFKC